MRYLCAFTCCALAVLVAGNGCSTKKAVGIAPASPAQLAVAPRPQPSLAPPPPAEAAKPAALVTLGPVTPDVDSTLAIQQAPGQFNTEAYDRIEENPFLAVRENPLSTFSIDVDTASYANMRRFVNDGQRPPRDAVRIEELINYFTYDYAPPRDGKPFAVHVASASAPWKPDHRLVRIALKGKEIDLRERPASNLTFLLDVSGSMQDENKLPLVKRAMTLLVDQLQPSDRVSIVVYAGASGLVLKPTQCDEHGREDITSAIERLESGGSTHGSEGIRLAYQTASEGFIRNGTNRVILCTDGDFNVGITNEGDLTALIEEKAKSGVFLTVLGFGMGNLKDSMMEKLADKGNGNYGYIDSYNEARKAFVEQMAGTLITIAKDVKIQVEFNPAKVQAYRLIGYENRLLNKEDFNDDTKDAGEIGAGHTVTALYELVPVGVPMETPGVDPLVYQKPTELTSEAKGDDLLLVKLRYKAPDAGTSELITQRVTDDGKKLEQADTDFQFAACVAEFGMLLRNSPHKGSATYDEILARAKSCSGEDPQGYRAEFISLVHKAKSLPSQ